MDSNTLSHVGAELIETLLHEHFGKRCTLVGMALFRNGTLSFLELKHAIGFPFLELRHCLTILILQNAVTYSTVSETVVYTFHSLQVLYRLRFPRFCLFLQQHKDPVCRILFMEVLKYGRVTLKFLFEQLLKDNDEKEDTITALWKETNSDDENNGKGHHNDLTDISKNKLKNSSTIKLKEETLSAGFMSLIKENYIIRVDQDDNKNACLISQSAKSKDTMIVCPGNKRKKITKATSNKSTKLDVAFTVALTDYDLKGMGTSSNHNMSGGKNLLRNELFPLTTSKSVLKKEESVSVKSLINNLNLHNVVFRVNIPFMNFLLLRELAENFMAAKWGESRLVRCITRILLKSVRFDALNACITNGMTFSDICSELERVGQEEENPFPIDDSNKLLHLFDAFDRTDSIIHAIPMFIFDWECFKRCVQERIFFNAVVASHGEKAGRIWGLLRSSQNIHTDFNIPKLWEDQQVSDEALLPPSVTREILYRLAASGFVRMHQSVRFRCLITVVNVRDILPYSLKDLVTGAPTTSSSKHGLVFYASISLIKCKLIEKTYQTILNLWQRKQHEAKEITELMRGNITEPDLHETQLHQREAAEDHLECSLLQLDATVILPLRDFI
ncbi:uncharacterized protein LOC128884355 isoform X2 [Hylaeus volcanicus]|uniref:uncharacterized protein LOC128884355 isoform X2 n=1 Tax=Hylaeus volcanicus TaxID=313075 RepID=UPI0023B87063|nr:uncharacterized protein LOC128884355 isoform X2 [Hylaeus volcanicus]